MPRLKLGLRRCWALASFSHSHSPHTFFIPHPTLDLFITYPFVRNAIIAMVCLSVLSGVVGSYVVVRRMVFAAGGVTHASFGGIGLAYLLGLNPTFGALAFAVVTALSIHFSTRRGSLRSDSAIAILWSLGMAMGVIALSLAPGYAPNLMGFMFGDVLAVSIADVWANIGAALVAVLLAVLFYRPLLYSSFDPDYARLAGWHPDVVSLVAWVVMALAISLSIKAVGIILVLSVFTIPQAIVMSFSHRFATIMVTSALVALVGCVGGLALSFAFDLPSGAVITALLCLVLLIIKIIKKS